MMLRCPKELSYTSYPIFEKSYNLDKLENASPGDVFLAQRHPGKAFSSNKTGKTYLRVIPYILGMERNCLDI